jgi:hypothetical protein
MNTLRRFIVRTGLACGLAALAAVPSIAVVTQARHLHLVAAFAPLHSKAVPYTGTLDLSVDSSGIINGSYKSTSTRPDPFANKFNKVTGGISGDNVNLHIGSPPLSFNGKNDNGTWQGTASWRGTFYSFTAKEAH